MNTSTLKTQRVAMLKSVDSPNLSAERKAQLKKAIADIDKQLSSSKPAPKAKTATKAKAGKKAPKEKQQSNNATIQQSEVANRAIFDFYAFTGGNKVSFDRLSTWVNTFAANVKKGKISKENPNYALLSTIYNIGKNAYNRAVANKTNTTTLKVGADITGKIEKMLVYAITDQLAGIDEEEEDLDGLGCDCDTKKKSLGSIEASNLSLDNLGDRIELKGEWKQIFGKPTQGFKALVFGKAGSGKTTMLLDFARDFASTGGKVNYVTGEQAKLKNGSIVIADTFLERLFSRNANVKNLMISAEVPTDFRGTDLLILDSVQALDISPDQLEEIADENPNLSIIIVSQINKRGNYKGTTEWAHNPDMIIELPSYGIAEASKNRFGALGTINFD